jgi:hypothetical protein
MAPPERHHQNQSSESAVAEHVNIAGDLIWHASGIAHELGVTERRAAYLLSRRLIPARQIGAVWVASRRELRAALCGDTAA